MVNVAHDVSKELRDPQGKWTVGGGALRAAARAARAGGAGSGGGRSHEEILGHVRNLPKGSGRRINGHHVDRTQGDKYRVGFRKAGGGRDTKLYGSPEDAAKAIHTGEHHEAGSGAAAAGGARTRGAAKPAAPKPEGNAGPGRYTVVLTGKPNADKTHYGVRDNQAGHNIIEGVDHTTARETAMDRNASVPKGDERPYAQTPEAQLRDMVTRGGNKAAATELTKRIVAEQKAKTEAENKARFPGGSTTVNTGAGVGTGKPDLAGGATPPKSRTFAQVSKEHTDARAAMDRLLNMRQAPGPAAIPARRREIVRLETELHQMGARRTSSGGYEMPPKKGTPAYDADRLKRDLAQLTEELRGTSYSPADLVAVREDDVRQQLRSGVGRTVVIKVPSGHEVAMNRETAEHILKVRENAKASGRKPAGASAPPNARQQAINLAAVNGQIRRAQDIVEDPSSVSKYGQAEVDRQKARLVQLRRRRAGMQQPAATGSLGETLSKSPRSRQTPRH